MAREQFFNNKTLRTEEEKSWDEHGKLKKGMRQRKNTIRRDRNSYQIRNKRGRKMRTLGGGGVN